MVATCPRSDYPCKSSLEAWGNRKAFPHNYRVQNPESEIYHVAFPLQTLRCLWTSDEGKGNKEQIDGKDCDKMRRSWKKTCRKLSRVLVRNEPLPRDGCTGVGRLTCCQSNELGTDFLGSWVSWFVWKFALWAKTWGYMIWHCHGNLSLLRELGQPVPQLKFPWGV